MTSNLARHLVQGVDVWLNNPRRPLEASGTSGQKVVLNGGLNCSILDGWWAEAYDGQNGFAIGNGHSHIDDSIQDDRDAKSLTRVLLDQVIPLFFDRNEEDGLPEEWIARMKRSVRTLGWRFNADRMVMDYVNHAYNPRSGWSFGAAWRECRNRSPTTVHHAATVRSEKSGQSTPIGSIACFRTIIADRCNRAVVDPHNGLSASPPDPSFRTGVGRTWVAAVGIDVVVARRHGGQYKALVEPDSMPRHGTWHACTDRS